MPQQSGTAVTPPAATARPFEQQVRELQVRRDMLNEQYQEAMQQRGQIGQERMNAQARGEAATVREYEATVERLGNRMKELEARIRATDAQIDQAIGGAVLADEIAPVADVEPVSVTVVPPIPRFDFMAQRVEYQRMMMIEGAVLLMVGALLWRFGVARGRRLAARVVAPRDDQLQQSIDAIAIEVERLSEGQRFINNVMAGRYQEREGAAPLPVQGHQAPGQPLRAQPLAMPEPRDSDWITPH